MDARNVGVGALNRPVGGGTLGQSAAGHRRGRSWATLVAGAYNWCPELDYMADGVTSSVYRCRHAKSGQFFAIKVFKDRPPAREIELLRQLEHPNIVKLIDRVQFADQSGVSRIGLVLEYCPIGCLHDYLKLPANWLGLCDSELLTLLFNMSDGLDYLRGKKKVLHRDIKPGNILMSYDSRRKPIFKLADFGSSRELEDGDEFQSLVGTYEFLHPQIYQEVYRRLHQRSVNSAPSAGHRPECDLWSLGVTLYQAATGQLPFSPYEGVRKNHERMIELMVNKPAGMISANESAPNGCVTYSDKLPTESSVSCELKAQLTSILQGILSCDFNEQWSFAKFFDTVRDLKAKSVTYYFIAGCMFSPDLVLSDCTFDSLQRSLSAKTGYSTEEIIIYYRSQLVTAFPTGTAPTSPIIVLSMQRLHCALPAHQLEFSTFNQPLPMADANNVKEVKDYTETAYKQAQFWQNVSKTAHLHHSLTLEAKEAALQQFGQRSQQAVSLADNRTAMCSSAQQKAGRLLELARLLRAQLHSAAFTDQVLQWQQRLDECSTGQQLEEEVGETAVEQLRQQFASGFAEFGQPAEAGECVAAALLRAQMIYERYAEIFETIRRNHTQPMQLILEAFPSDKRLLAECIADMHKTVRTCCAELLMNVCAKMDCWLRECFKPKVDALLMLERQLQSGVEADLDMLHDLIFRGVHQALLAHFTDRNVTRESDFHSLNKAIKSLMESTALVEDEMSRNAQLLRQLDELGLRNSGLSSLDSQVSADSQ